MKLTTERRGCVFDLDVREHNDEEDDENLEGKFSVDCGSMGQSVYALTQV